jgi:hypothetical protein
MVAWIVTGFGVHHDILTTFLFSIFIPQMAKGDKDIREKCTGEICYPDALAADKKAGNPSFTNDVPPLSLY